MTLGCAGYVCARTRGRETESMVADEMVKETIENRG